MAATKKDEPIVYLDIGMPCKGSWLFDVPHREEPMKMRRLLRKFPKLVLEFDGTAKECTLLWYYKYNKAEGVFEFRDSDAEDEFAELLGVDLCASEFIDENSKGSAGRALTEEERLAVREHLADIRRGLDFLGAKRAELDSSSV